MGQLVPPTVGITILEEQRLGYFGLSLTNFTTLGVPQIVGNVEVAGSLYTFSTPEDILGLTATPAGDMYVKLIPQVAGTISAVWTEIAPTWSDEKQGWYSPTLNEENQRYVFRATKVDNSNISRKAILLARGDDVGLLTEREARIADVNAEEAARIAADALILSPDYSIPAGSFTFEFSTPGSNVSLPGPAPNRYLVLSVSRSTTGSAPIIQLYVAAGGTTLLGTSIDGQRYSRYSVARIA